VGLQQPSGGRQATIHTDEINYSNFWFQSPIFPITTAVGYLERIKTNTLPKLHKVRPIAGYDNPEEGAEV